MLKHYLLALLLAIGFRPAMAAVFYVSPTGFDTNTGTITAPFLTIQRGQAAVLPGDTVYVRGGTYMMSNANASGHSTAAAAGSYAYITYLTKSGTAGARINYWAYSGEQPVFNYAGVDPNVTTRQGSGSSLTDDIYVYFENGATDSFEPAYDAVKLPNSTGLNLLASLSGKQLAIDGQGQRHHPARGTAGLGRARAGHLHLHYHPTAEPEHGAHLPA